MRIGLFKPSTFVVSIQSLGHNRKRGRLISEGFFIYWFITIYRPLSSMTKKIIHGKQWQFFSCCTFLGCESSTLLQQPRRLSHDNWHNIIIIILFPEMTSSLFSEFVKVSIPIEEHMMKTVYCVIKGDSNNIQIAIDLRIGVVKFHILLHQVSFMWSEIQNKEKKM